MNRFCGLLHKPGSLKNKAANSPVLPYKQSFYDNTLTIWSEGAGISNFIIHGHVCADQFVQEPLKIRETVVNMPEKAYGSWVSASIDEMGKVLTLARDRIGGRSLYFVDNPAFFAFATDIKLIFQHAPVLPSLNRPMVFDYFILSEFDGLEEKLFEHIRELKPGCRLVYDVERHDFQISSYYTPSFNSKFTTFDPIQNNEFQHGLRERLDHTFGALMSDTSTKSSFLSGGLDSSIIAVYASKFRKSDWQFFTAGFPGKTIDESQEANAILDFLQMDNWIKVFPHSQGFADDLEDMMKTIELPTTSAGTFIQYSLMKKMQELGTNSVLDGTGADALFAGHHYQYAFLWRELIRNGNINRFRKESASAAIVSQPIRYLIKNELKYAVLHALPVHLQFALRMRYYPELKFLHPDIRETYKSRMNRTGITGQNSLNALLFSEYHGGGVRKLLRYVLRCGERFDVEVRFPYAESGELMDFMFSIPGTYKIHDGKLKYLVREAYKDMLPEQLYRGSPKKGLLSPNNRWIREHKDYFKALLLDGNEDIFDTALLEKEYERFFHPISDLENYRIFKFISFAVWRKTFNI